MGRYGQKTDEVVTLADGSELFEILAAPAATVVLPRTLECKGIECELQDVANVRVGSAVYEYVQPTCVHLYIYNGKSTVMTAGARGLGREFVCVDPTAPVAAAACCAGSCT